jgi:hopanoid biosynthesis associated protein HpnK
MDAIFNADDFGRSSNINAAIFRAHCEGILTSASLMVTGEAAGEAVRMAREAPGLAVGLHLTLTDALPASPPGELPHLVGRTGRLPADPVRVWIRLLFSPAARAEMARELQAQCERFAATGLPLAHVDGHQHLHMHPAVFRALLPLAAQYGARGVRLPRDDFRLALSYSRRSAGIKAVWAAAFGLLCHFYARGLARAGQERDQVAGRQRPAITDRVYGVLQTGQMEEAYVLQVLGTAQARAIELYFHPSIGPEAMPLGPNAGDLATLLSPAVRQAVEARGWRLASYATLE